MRDWNKNLIRWKQLKFSENSTKLSASNFPDATHDGLPNTDTNYAQYFTVLVILYFSHWIFMLLCCVRCFFGGDFSVSERERQGSSLNSHDPETKGINPICENINFIDLLRNLLFRFYDFFFFRPETISYEWCRKIFSRILWKREKLNYATQKEEILTLANKSVSMQF